MYPKNSKINKALLGLIAVAFVIGGYFYFFANQNTVASFQDNGQRLSEDIISCEFDITSIFIYKNKSNAFSEENRKVYYETLNNKSLILVTFAGLSTKNAKIKGNNGDSPITILKNDEASIILVEQNDVGDMFTYTIFKKEKIAVWNKTYKLIGMPYALTSMGYCY